MRGDIGARLLEKRAPDEDVLAEPRPVSTLYENIAQEGDVLWFVVDKEEIGPNSETF
jgi:hypothetical protein